MIASAGDSYATQRHEDRYIETFLGNKFYLDPSKGSPPNIVDIGYALAACVRFTGHTDVPLSVARHSLMVSEIAEQIAIADGAPVDIVRLTGLYGLLHDASEAYLSDIAAPFKDAIEGYRQLEDQIQTRIFDELVPGYCPSPRINDYVKQADIYCLFIEAYLFGIANKYELSTWLNWMPYGAAAINCAEAIAEEHYFPQPTIIEDALLSATEDYIDADLLDLTRNEYAEIFIDTYESLYDLIYDEDFMNNGN